MSQAHKNVDSGDFNFTDNEMIGFYETSTFSETDPS